MNALIERLQAIFAAVAFAEAGEWKPAMEIAEVNAVPQRASVGIAQTLHTTFAAVAFAEANCPEMALETLHAPLEKNKGFMATVGLVGVRARFLAVPAGPAGFLEAVGLLGVRNRLGIVRMEAGALA